MEDNVHIEGFWTCKTFSFITHRHPRSVFSTISIFFYMCSLIVSHTPTPPLFSRLLPWCLLISALRTNYSAHCCCKPSHWHVEVVCTSVSSSARSPALWLKWEMVNDFLFFVWYFWVEGEFKLASDFFVSTCLGPFYSEEAVTFVFQWKFWLILVFLINWDKTKPWMTSHVYILFLFSHSTNQLPLEIILYSNLVGGPSFSTI